MQCGFLNIELQTAPHCAVWCGFFTSTYSVCDYCILQVVLISLGAIQADSWASWHYFTCFWSVIKVINKSLTKVTQQIELLLGPLHLSNIWGRNMLYSWHYKGRNLTIWPTWLPTFFHVFSPIDLFV